MVAKHDRGYASLLGCVDLRAPTDMPVPICAVASSAVLCYFCIQPPQDFLCCKWRSAPGFCGASDPLPCVSWWGLMLTFLLDLMRCVAVYARDPGLGILRRKNCDVENQYCDICGTELSHVEPLHNAGAQPSAHSHTLPLSLSCLRLRDGGCTVAIEAERLSAQWFVTGHAPTEF